MTETAVYLQPAFILYQQKYRETSLILDVLTADFGRISLLAKGVRKPKSKTAALLQPFVPLAISYVGKTDLKILTDVEIRPPIIPLSGLALYCGFYINELTGFFLHQYDPHPEVFDDYQNCMIGLSTVHESGSSNHSQIVADPVQFQYLPETISAADDEKDSIKKISAIEIALRLFEYGLMEHTGYGLQLEYDVCNDQAVDPAKKYLFNNGQGLVEARQGLISGASLQAIGRKDFSDPQVLIEAKLLMRTVIDSQLQGRQLKSRNVINQIIKKL